MLYIIAFLLTLNMVFGYEKVYVIQRENSCVAVIDRFELKREICSLGNLNHAVLKFDPFYKNSAYVISRDGYFSKIDTKEDKLLKKVKTGKSGIGFTILKNHIAIAHYEPREVVILEKNLDQKIRINTDSRNVGIKTDGRYVVFSLMDKDQIWILDSKEDFRVSKKFYEVGKMPFDALLKDRAYIVGFFRESSLGILNLENFLYKKQKLKEIKEGIPLKIPHFGTWGIYGTKAYIPAVGDNKIHIIDLQNFSYRGFIEVLGFPVFVTVSPIGNFLVVNYSGEKEDYISVITIKENRVLKHLKAGERVMHFRFSKDGQRLYLSSYFDNKLKIFNTASWEVIKEIDVPFPSGVFIKK
ncbi:MAG: NirF protein [Aquificae bacterium]|nr:NirF protein [Aquificota bacterium]